MLRNGLDVLLGLRQLRLLNEVLSLNAQELASNCCNGSSWILNEVLSLNAQELWPIQVSRPQKAPQ